MKPWLSNQQTRCEIQLKKHTLPPTHIQSFRRKESDQLNFNILIAYLTREEGNPVRATKAANLPGGLLDPIQHALVSQVTENETRHAKGGIDTASAACEDAAVPDSSEGTISRKLGKLVAILLSDLIGKAGIVGYGFVEPPPELELGGKNPAMVVSEIMLLITIISSFPYDLMAVRAAGNEFVLVTYCESTYSNSPNII
ncbi:hypothetical protein F8388_002574 [Cannabis sativa]|nr:hypothetical protein F8388_002574 [Cannabis sativa]